MQRPVSIEDYSDGERTALLGPEWESVVRAALLNIKDGETVQVWDLTGHVLWTVHKPNGLSYQRLRKSELQELVMAIHRKDRPILLWNGLNLMDATGRVVSGDAP